jgi:hypothetical protein
MSIVQQSIERVVSQSRDWIASHEAPLDQDFADELIHLNDASSSQRTDVSVRTQDEVDADWFQKDTFVLMSSQSSSGSAACCWTPDSSLSELLDPCDKTDCNNNNNNNDNAFNCLNSTCCEETGSRKSESSIPESDIVTRDLISETIEDVVRASVQEADFCDLPTAISSCFRRFLDEKGSDSHISDHCYIRQPQQQQDQGMEMYLMSLLNDLSLDYELDDEYLNDTTAESVNDYLSCPSGMDQLLSLCDADNLIKCENWCKRERRKKTLPRILTIFSEDEVKEYFKSEEYRLSDGRLTPDGPNDRNKTRSTPTSERTKSTSKRRRSTPRKRSDRKKRPDSSCRKTVRKAKHGDVEVIELDASISLPSPPTIQIVMSD